MDLIQTNRATIIKVFFVELTSLRGGELILRSQPEHDLVHKWGDGGAGDAAQPHAPLRHSPAPALRVTRIPYLEPNAQMQLSNKLNVSRYVIGK